jgi:hypothetical protein
VLDKYLIFQADLKIALKIFQPDRRVCRKKISRGKYCGMVRDVARKQLLWTFRRSDKSLVPGGNGAAVRRLSSQWPSACTDCGIPTPHMFVYTTQVVPKRSANSKEIKRGFVTQILTVSGIPDLTYPPSEYVAYLVKCLLGYEKACVLSTDCGDGFF